MGWSWRGKENEKSRTSLRLSYLEWLGGWWYHLPKWEKIKIGFLFYWRKSRYIEIKSLAVSETQISDIHGVLPCQIGNQISEYRTGEKCLDWRDWFGSCQHFMYLKPWEWLKLSKRWVYNEESREQSPIFRESRGKKTLERHWTALVREVEGRPDNCSVLDSNGRFFSRS